MKGPIKRLFLNPIVIGVLITPFLMALTAVSGGVGHGSYALGMALFPFAALPVIILDHFFNATFLMIVIAAIQFPLYGLVLTRAKLRFVYVALGILVIHALTALTVILISYS